MDKLDAVADRGYFNSEEIRACEEAGITVTLPKPMTSNAKAEGRFGKQDFRYVADEDIYVCPAGEKLAYHYTTEENGLALRATDQRLPKLRYQTHLHTGKDDGSPDGNTSTFSKPYNAGSTSIRRRCASAARRSNIRSEPSRPEWEQSLPDEDAAAGCLRDGAARVAYNLTRA